MAFPGRSARAWRVFTLATLLALLLATPVQALRLVGYNILNHPGSSGPARAPNYRTILAPPDAEMIVTGERSSPPGGEARFLNEALNVMEPGRRVAVLADREFAPGSNNLPGDGRGESGGTLGSGLYFVRLTTRGLPPRTVRLAVIR